MAPPRDDYLSLSLTEWYDALADSGGIPGGGSALASALTSAASVLAMCARASGNAGHAAQAASLRARTAPMAELDAETYGAALRARDELHSLGVEQRDFQLGRAFAREAEPPLEIARAAADVAELAAAIVESGDPRVRADAQAALALAAGVARGAVALVQANLTALPDDPRVAQARRAAEDAAQSARRAGC
jgi:formiminotetrahydrofolate cyclodeaminase